MSNNAQEIRMVGVGELEPHADADGFWTLDSGLPPAEDVHHGMAAITASVKASGVHQPLIVTPKADGAGYWVVDGCARLAAAWAAGITELPCIVRGYGGGEEADRAMFALNMDRKRFTAGQRVMKWLIMHRHQVLNAYDGNRDPRKTGAKGGRGKKPIQNVSAFSGKGYPEEKAFSGKGYPQENPFSMLAIAGHLGASLADVHAGVELLVCHDRESIVWLNPRTGRREIVPLLEDWKKDSLAAVWAGVLSGEIPLRTWLPSFHGKCVDPAKSGKAAINYHSHAHRTFAQIETIFTRWGEVEKHTQAVIIRRFKDSLGKMPEDLRRAFLDVAEDEGWVR